VQVPSEAVLADADVRMILGAAPCGRSTLDALAPDDWERTATVTSYGQANERTLRSYASQLAKHERTHVRQIERTLTLADAAGNNADIATTMSRD
jgi:hypothetical protein